MTYRSGRHFLQIPGPTNVPDRILRAIDMPTMDHRGPEFASLLAGLTRALQGAVAVGHGAIPPNHLVTLRRDE